MGFKVFVQTSLLAVRPLEALVWTDKLVLALGTLPRASWGCTFLSVRLEYERAFAYLLVRESTEDLGQVRPLASVLGRELVCQKRRESLVVL